MKKLDPLKENMVIIDANYFAYRAFHGYHPHLDIKKNDQRVLKGLLSFIFDLTYCIDKIDNIVLAFDPPDGNNYRKSIYRDYKANRKEPEIDFLIQKNNAIHILGNIIGLPLVCCGGYEADDVLGSLTEIYKNKYQIILVSVDKDIAQLVDKNVLLMRKNIKKGENKYTFLGQEEVRNGFGVAAGLIPDLLALVGDVADNIPGVSGIGPKKAASLLEEFSSLGHLLAFVKDAKKHNNYYIRDEISREIEKNKEQLVINKILTTIRKDILDRQRVEKIMLNFINTKKAVTYNNNLDKLANYFYLDKKLFTPFKN